MQKPTKILKQGEYYLWTFDPTNPASMSFIAGPDLPEDLPRLRPLAVIVKNMDLDEWSEISEQAS